MKITTKDYKGFEGMDEEYLKQKPTVPAVQEKPELPKPSVPITGGVPTMSGSYGGGSEGVVPNLDTRGSEGVVPNVPEYQSPYQLQIDQLVGDIQGRPDFQFDINADDLYKLYKDQYIANGKLAMQDTMGQAQAMTGGYGNSYALGAGQGAYQSYMRGLTDIIPELYKDAYSRYIQQGDDQYQRLNMLGNLDAQSYQRYMDGLQNNQWQASFNEDKRRYDQEWYALHPELAPGYVAPKGDYYYTPPAGGDGLNDFALGSLEGAKNTLKTNGAGGAQADVAGLLNQLIVAGASRAEMNGAIEEARANGEITTQQARELKDRVGIPGAGR